MSTKYFFIRLNNLYTCNILCHKGDTLRALYFSKIFIHQRKLNYFVEFVWGWTCSIFWCRQQVLGVSGEAGLVDRTTVSPQGHRLCVAGLTGVKNIWHIETQVSWSTVNHVKSEIHWIIQNWKFIQQCYYFVYTS